MISACRASKEEAVPRNAGKIAVLIALLGLGTVMFMLSGCTKKSPNIDPCLIFPQICTPPPNPQPVPAPTPTPKPEPTPTPAPPGPAPTSGPEISGGAWEVEGIKYPSAARPAPLYAHTVDNALVELTGCAVNSDCVYTDDIQTTIKKVAAILRAEGYAAGQFEPGITDEIAIGATGLTTVDEAQGYHIFNTGGNKVVWSNAADWQHGKGAYRDTWHRISIPDPVESPVEPPVITIAKHPVTRMQLKKVGTARQVFDATPQTGPDKPFCLSIGKDQDYCPLGGECVESTPADQCAKIGAARTAAEAAAGPYTWQHWRNGVLLGDGGPANDVTPNPLQWVFPNAQRGDTIVVCAGNGVCSTPLGVQ